MIFDLEFKRRAYKRRGRENTKPGLLPIRIKKLLLRDSTLDILRKNGIDTIVNSNKYLRS